MKRHHVSVLLTLFAYIIVQAIGCGSNGARSTAHDASALNMTFVSIPGGTFQMGDEVGDLWEGCRPVHTVTVSGFEMGAYEVTNAQYAIFLNDALAAGDIEMKDGDVFGKTGEWAGQRYLDLGYDYGGENKCWVTFGDGKFLVTGGYENWPVVAVSWYGSKAFATFYGFELPTEAEWEYAARGGKQFRYGTDDGTIDSTKVNYDMHVGHPTPVGAYPANPFGLYDMSGNIWEWCNDWYGPYPEGNVTDPTGAPSDSIKIIRDGTWDNQELKCRVMYRGRFKPAEGDYGLGFRVVRRK